MTNNDIIHNIYQHVLRQAEQLGIPVSKDILEPISVNKRAKTRFGCCRVYKNGYKIEISEFLLSGPKKSIEEILAHEILHTCKGCQNHSTLWKKYALMMNSEYGYNIKRTSNHKDLGIVENSQTSRVAKYTFHCTGCGQIFQRTRKSKLVTHTNLYRCKCGCKLIRREI